MISQDFTGKTFGDLMIIKRAPSKVREAKWYCLCSCGRNTIIATSKLKRGQKYCSTCSKARREKPKNFIDLMNQRFGSLTVISRGEDNKNGHLRWKCKCDCGNDILVTSAQIKKQKHCKKCYLTLNHNNKEKKCSRCKLWKPLEQFAVRNKTLSGRAAYCTECQLQYQKRWIKEHYYSISELEYQQAVINQNGRCAVCEREADLILDHCHKTGRFRGLVCRLCNVVLGRFKDDPHILNKAIRYLTKYTK